MDEIELKHAGPGDRMHGILDDKYVTYYSNGSVTAKTKSHQIEIQQNGMFSIYIRKSGELFLKKIIMENIDLLFQYTILQLRSMSIKHEWMKFDSGAIMLDVWYKNQFYVIQFDPDGYIGFSEVNNDNISFDNVPDVRIFDESIYREKLHSILK